MARPTLRHFDKGGHWIAPNSSPQEAQKPRCVFMTNLPLRTIPLNLSDGKLWSARTEGNYAAWICSCGESVPLLGRCFPSANPPNTVCPSCGRRYKILSLRSKPVAVAEIPRKSLENT